MIMKPVEVNNAIKRNNDYRYDLKIGNIKENEFAQLFDDYSTFEIKYDTYDNDKHFIEHSRKEFKNETNIIPTGISTTEADYYVLCKKGYYIVLFTKHLKRTLLSKTRYNEEGGDDNRTLAALLTESEILEYCRNLDKPKLNSTVNESEIPNEIIYKGVTYVRKGE